MKPRSCAVIRLGLSVLLSFACGHPAWAQDMSVAPSGDDASNRIASVIKSKVDNLNLKSFDAYKDDQGACAGNSDCQAQADKIKSWICVSTSCDGTSNGKAPLDCFEGASAQFADKDVQKQLNSSLCSLMASPGSLTRKALLSHLDRGASEDDLIEYGAYLFALKGAKDSCEEYIKDYLGPFGSRWDSHWFAALSGCRILTHASTSSAEEKDYSTWFGAAQGTASCADIINPEMRNECFDPGATSSLSAFVQQ